MTDPKPISVSEAEAEIAGYDAGLNASEYRYASWQRANLITRRAFWQRILATAEERRWVPVSERLPEDGQYVVVTGADEPYDLLYRSAGRWFSPWSNNEQSERYAATFTHWMPLPAQPEV